MSVSGAKYHVDREALEERIAIRVEHIARPTPKQLHDALNATLADLRERYGEIEVAQWPRVDLMAGGKAG